MHFDQDVRESSRIGNTAVDFLDRELLLDLLQPIILRRIQTHLVFDRTSVDHRQSGCHRFRLCGRPVPNLCPVIVESVLAAAEPRERRRGTPDRTTGLSCDY